MQTANIHLSNPLEPPKWDSSSFGLARSREVSNISTSSTGSIIQQPPFKGRPPLSNSATHPAPRSVPPPVNHYVRQFPPPNSVRSFTVLREVGDGSFGTVWLADWHSELALPPGTTPPGPSNRPEYKGKKLVAIKRMKKAFEGGWDECLKLKELKVGFCTLSIKFRFLLRNLD